MAACSACAAVSSIQFTYGVTAVTMAVEAGPSHSSEVSWLMMDRYCAAMDFSSAASELHAEEATTIGSEPGPE
nr:hypothetical protein CPGR_01587 [Mycolicibacter nonchromogenicus]